ncbi:MAG: hypothetical protein HC904_04000 [Blastochloris sp.]|nr:hypothetical protein [Blastochloris sp.]
MKSKSGSRKKPGDLSQALLLRQFPDRHKLTSGPQDPLRSARSSVFLAVSALIITLITSVILLQRHEKAWAQEKAQNLQLREQLAQERQQWRQRDSIAARQGRQNARLVQAVQEVLSRADPSQAGRLREILPEAVRVQMETGIPASVLLSVALQSGEGENAELARTTYNFAALLVNEAQLPPWKGASLDFGSKEKGKATRLNYRVYSSPGEALDDLAQWFLNSSSAEERSAADSSRRLLNQFHTQRGSQSAGTLQKSLEQLERLSLENLDQALIPLPAESTPPPSSE